MTKPDETRPLTELEGAALAFLKRSGPCTAYVVKEAFRTSASEFWSGSAGALYPLMKRLEAQGLVVSREDKDRARARRDFTLTAAGEAAMKDWLLDSHRAAGSGFDPLRARLCFADMMSESEFKDFIAATLAEITPPPASEKTPPKTSAEAAHLTTLHKLWSRMRVNALRSFAKDALPDRDAAS